MIRIASSNDRPEPISFVHLGSKKIRDLKPLLSRTVGLGRSTNRASLQWRWNWTGSADQLVLALLSPPYCSASYDPHAVDSGNLQVDNKRLRDGRVRCAVSRPEAKFDRLSWSYRASNCVALTLAELGLLPDRRTIFPNLPPHHETRCHTIRFECDLLTLRMVLPQGFAISAKAIPIVERQIDRADEAHWERVQSEERAASGGPRRATPPVGAGAGHRDPAGRHIRVCAVSLCGSRS